MIEKIKENINNPEKLEKLYRDDRKSFESGFEKVGVTISKYLPVYIIWTLIVIFGFPVISGMK